MAWNTINHTCGHEQRIQLYGPVKGRENTVASMERQLCPDCRRATHTQPEFIFTYTELSDESKHTARETIIEILQRKGGLDRSLAFALMVVEIKTASFDVFGNRVFPLQDKYKRSKERNHANEGEIKQ